MAGLGAKVQSRPAPRASKIVGPVAPLSVAPLLPESRKEEGLNLLTTASGRRVPIRPSICGIPSNQFVSLRSPTAIDKTRELFVEHQKRLWLEHQQKPRQKHSFQQHQHGQRSPSDIGPILRPLKYGRLQPLGVVDSEAMNPEEVLGVLPVRLQNSGAQDMRPNSCAPEPRQVSLSERNAAIMAKVKPRKRSYSAVLSQELTGEELGEMLYLSRHHMALIPQATATKKEDVDLQDLSRTLPAVTGRKAMSSKNKVKSLRQGRHQNSKANESQDEVNAIDKLPPIDQDGGPVIDVKISTTSSPDEDADAKAKTSQTPKAKASKDKSRSPQTLSPKIVSIGAATEADRTAVKKKHHPGSAIKGRLSSGWSSPVPIAGLSGSPIHTAKGNKEASDKAKRGESNGAANEDSNMLQRASTPGMMVNINITDFLGTDSDPDSGSTRDQEDPEDTA